MYISCNASQTEEKERILVKFIVYAFFFSILNLSYFTRFFPPFDLVKFYPFLPSTPFETHFNPFVNTGNYAKKEQDKKKVFFESDSLLLWT